MKIGVITIHNSPSYGACLQSFALYEYLREQGHEVEIIDLHRPYQKDYVKSKVYIPYSKINKQSWIKRLFGFVCKKKKTYLSAICQEKFDEFYGKIKLSRPYFGVDELYANPPIYDIYITGSDQVWNPTQPYCIEPYFLTFAPKGRKRISYAASLGLDYIPDDLKPKYRLWLEQYDRISVRESETKDLLESFSNKQMDVVADPTFLIDIEKWKSMLLLPEKTESYIMLFTLGYKPTLLEYCKKLSKESGLRLKYISSCLTQGDNEYDAINDAGPREFLGYISRADLVITDSFHGTVFSLLLGTKNVFTYMDKDFKRGVRMRELYNIVGYESHLITGTTKNYEDLCHLPLDHDLVQRRIDEAAETSRKFLLSCLL